MKNLCLLFIFLLSMQSITYAVKKPLKENNMNVENKNELKENKEDFQRISLLKAILDRCANQDVITAHNTWMNFIIQYSQYIIEKEHLQEEEIALTIINAELAVEDKFGSIAPESVCKEALEKSKKQNLLWLKIKPSL